MLPYLPRPCIFVDRRGKPSVELPPSCPRCDSTNTKFCYYNNYSLSQPRYFCKACRRYWTKGGSLRNVPIGGGCRKSRRPKTGRIAAADAESRFGDRRQLQAAQNSLRPDFLLNDPTGSSCLSDSGGAGVSSAGHPRPQGADIDLALLYAKFLNHRSENDSGFSAPGEPLPFEVDEPFELPSIADSGQHVGVYQEDHRCHTDFQRSELSDVVAETQLRSEPLPSTGPSSFYSEPGFGLPHAPSGEEILGDADVFWSSCETVLTGWSWEQVQSPGIGTVEEEHLHLQPPGSPFISIWNNFSLASCEAFPKN